MSDKELRYPIPPDLTVGKYIFGYTGMEWLVLAGTSLAALIVLISAGLLKGMVAVAVPAALAVLCHRHDSGNGYVNAAWYLYVRLRYHGADMISNEEFSLKRALKTNEEKERKGKKDGEGKDT